MNQSLNHDHEQGSQKSKGIIAWFVYNPVAANLLMITLLVVGFMSLADIRTEGFPEPSPNTVTISVDFEGGSPENVEEGAAIKIEEALNGIEGVYKISSQITSNNVTVSVAGDDGYPLEKLKNAVKTRVDAINTFPAQVDSVVITEAQEEKRILLVQIYGDAKHQTFKKVARQIRKRLLSMDTVNKVTVRGVRDAEINIEIQEEKLRNYGLTFDEVARSVQGASINLSAGELRTSAGIINLQSRQQDYHGNEFENIIVRSSSDGGVVRLKDVAVVRDGFTDQEILSTFLGKPSVNLDVELIGSDSVVIASDDVRTFVENLKKENWLPQTLDIVVWSDEADNVRDSISLLSKNALMGMCLVLVMLALFLHPKVALWVAVGIPVCFAGTFIVMGPSLLDYSINDLTGFAFIIVLGIVVDDAIIIGESIFTHKKRDGGGVETAIRGAKQVAMPATFGVLTTIAAFYPLTTITGFFGGPFRMIAVVVIFCLLFSIIESKLILPAHLANLNVKNKKPKKQNFIVRGFGCLRERIENGLEHFIYTHYKPLIGKVVTHRYQSLGVFVAIFIMALGLVTSGTVRVVFFGGDEGNLLYAGVKMHSGTPAEKTHKAALYIEEKLDDTVAELMEVYRLKESPLKYSYIASNTDEEAEVTIEITPGSTRPFYAEEFLDIWKEKVGEIDGTKELSFYVDYEGSEDFRVEISAFDYQILEKAMLMLKDKVESYNGLDDIRTNLDNNVDELSVQLKPEAKFLGLSNLEVISQLRNAVFGLEAQRIQRDDEEVRVKVRYPVAERNDASDLEKIRIRTAEGGAVPLSQITEVKRSMIQSEITRIDGNRVLALTAQVNEDIVTPSEIIAVMEEKVFPEILRVYPGVKIELAGESAEEGEAKTELSSGFILGMLLIYALLAIPLKSYIEPFIIMLAIPFGVIGAIIGHMIVGIPISLMSFFGILALSGVVVNDSLVLVSRYNQIKKTGKSYKEAVIEAGMSRFRAVLLTSITTFVGLMPLLREKSEQAQELIPMAVSLSFGILFATVITLLIIPVLLGVNSDIRRFFREKDEYTH
ncbi:MAG: efflux RND transporter permease subunit [Alphaproteobacteria bacterium]